MFTLDEEDNETEYGESYKSSMKSNITNSMKSNNGKIKYIKKILSSDEEDDEDLEPENDDEEDYASNLT